MPCPPPRGGGGPPPKPKLGGERPRCSPGGGGSGAAPAVQPRHAPHPVPPPWRCRPQALAAHPRTGYPVCTPKHPGLSHSKRHTHETGGDGGRGGGWGGRSAGAGGGGRSVLPGGRRRSPPRTDRQPGGAWECPTWEAMSQEPPRPPPPPRGALGLHWPTLRCRC